MLNLLIFLILLITILTIKEFELTKISDDEYNPFIFNFTLKDEIIGKYPFIFDTTESYILFQDELENKTIEEYCLIEIDGKNFCYYKTKENLMSKGYIGLIGISNIDRTDFKLENKNKSPFQDTSYLYMIQKEEENLTKYINFIQKEDDEALMIFGDIDSRFNKGTSRTCKCSNQYWSCEIVSLKIGGNEIYSSASSYSEYGIFSISEENIIVPYYQGKKILTYYKNKISELFGIDCDEKEEDNLFFLICKYFNYEDLPDLSFVMKGGIQIMALSIDLFKIVKNYNLVFKIKYTKGNGDKWYLGDPVVKNYNLLLNYSDKNNAYLTIIPASLNGFILIIVACVGGFLFLFIFLTIIYCSAKKDKKNKKRKSYLSGWKRGNRNNSAELFMRNTSQIVEKIEEHEDEDEKSEDSDKDKINKSEDDSDDKSDNKSDDDKSNSNSSNDSEKDNNDIEEKKLDGDEEKKDNIVNENNNNIDNLIINTKSENNNNTINNNFKLSINPNNKLVELSINNYEDDNDEENELINNNDK